MKKVILLDIDGTLTNSEKKITPKTKAALLKAQEEGALLAIASGRPTKGLYKYAHELEMDQHHGLLISFNGSKVVDCQTKEELFNDPMSIEDGKEVLEYMKKFDVVPIIDHGDYMYANSAYGNRVRINGVDRNAVEFESKSNDYLVCEMEDLAAFANFPINKILTAADPEYLNAHYEEMQAPFKDKLSCMFTAPHYFEFTAKGIDKGAAIDAVLGKMGYAKEDRIAFGDAQNDISMLKVAKDAVAMQNACQELKDVATFITKNNDEDGIAFALQRLGIVQ